MIVNVSHDLQLPNQNPFRLQVSSFCLFCQNWWCSWTWHLTPTATPHTQKTALLRGRVFHTERLLLGMAEGTS